MLSDANNIVWKKFTDSIDNGSAPSHDGGMKLKNEVQAVLDALENVSEKFQVVGAVRREEQPRNAIEVVAVSGMRMAKDPDDLFAERKVSAVGDEVDNLVRCGELRREGSKVYFKDTYIALVIHDSKRTEFVSNVIRYTGPQRFLIEIYTMVKGKGYRWLPYTLLNVNADRGMPRSHEITDERDFFAFIGMPWTEPKDREHGTWYPETAADDKVPMSENEFRAWRDSSRWTDTKSGGEAHQFSVRPAQKSDQMFRRVVNMIYEYGYDGMYHGMSWRYLDLDGIRYFTCAEVIQECSFVNRKPYFAAGHQVRAWAKNPVKMKLVCNRNRSRARLAA